MALPLNIVSSSFDASRGSGKGGSLISITIVLPRTSTALKASQPDSGATTPAPTNTSSESDTLISGTNRLVQTTASPGNARALRFPPTTYDKLTSLAVIPTRGTG